MNDINNQIDIVDRHIMTSICNDMINGTLFQEADNETLEMMLEMMSVKSKMQETKAKMNLKLMAKNLKFKKKMCLRKQLTKNFKNLKRWQE